MVFKPGMSGNPLGRPTGSRNKFSEAYLRDLAETWEAHGKEAMQKAALTDPSRFVAICATLIPKDVSLTISGRLEGALDDGDREILAGILNAVKQVRPDADRDETLQFITEAIALHDAKAIENCIAVASPLPSPEMLRRDRPENDSKTVA